MPYEREHTETYRGVDFAINREKFPGDKLLRLLEGDCHTRLRGTSFDRFFTDHELLPQTDLTRMIEIMHRAIDRLLARQYVYTGDLRERGALRRSGEP